MGIYINIGNAGFQSARNGEYVDKYKELPLGKLPLGNIAYICGIGLVN